jgi:hypothetical protein
MSNTDPTPKTQHRKLKRWATRTPPKTQHRKLKRWATRTPHQKRWKMQIKKCWDWYQIIYSYSHKGIYSVLWILDVVK